MHIAHMALRHHRVMVACAGESRRLLTEHKVFLACVAMTLLNLGKRHRSQKSTGRSIRLFHGYKRWISQGPARPGEGPAHKPPSPGREKQGCASTWRHGDEHPGVIAAILAVMSRRIGFPGEMEKFFTVGSSDRLAAILIFSFTSLCNELMRI